MKALRTRIIGRRSWLEPVFAALVAVSAAWMLAAGHTVADDGLARARPLLLAGGLSIQLAFYVQRRATRLRGDHPKRGRAWVQQLIAAGCIAACGLGLVLVGHTAFTSGWWPIGVAIVPLLSGVAAAGTFNRAAAQIRLTNKATWPIVPPDVSSPTPPDATLPRTLSPATDTAAPVVSPISDQPAPLLNRAAAPA